MESHVNLLLYMYENKTHYCLIKNMSRLLKSQLTKHKDSVHICDYCLHPCTTPSIFEKHLERCKLHGEQMKKMIKGGEIELDLKTSKVNFD